MPPSNPFFSHVDNQLFLLLFLLLSGKVLFQTSFSLHLQAATKKRSFLFLLPSQIPASLIPQSCGHKERRFSCWLSVKLLFFLGTGSTENKQLSLTCSHTATGTAEREAAGTELVWGTQTPSLAAVHSCTICEKTQTQTPGSSPTPAAPPSSFVSLMCPSHQTEAVCPCFSSRHWSACSTAPVAQGLIVTPPLLAQLDNRASFHLNMTYLNTLVSFNPSIRSQPVDLD